MTLLRRSLTAAPAAALLCAGAAQARVHVPQPTPVAAHNPADSVCYTKRGKLDRHIDDTTAHRDHVHIGMTKAGAAARTSFWRSSGRAY